jgi:V/A-type H+-transporting ATPase subunit K
MIELSPFIPAAALMMVSIVGAAWCLVRGSTIGASAMVEKPETSIWGLVLNVMGALILLFGFVTAMMLMMPESLSLLVVLASEIGIAACAFPIVSMIGKLRGGSSDDEIFPRTATWVTTFTVILISSTFVMMSGGRVSLLPIILGATTIVALITFFPRIATWGTTFIVIMISFVSVMMSGIGGDVGMIPDNAWPLLLGAVTMLGSALCAAICIMVAVKSGSVAMVEKPELSIWSLLFVALGEGLAIYGLIVALLIVMA